MEKIQSIFFTAPGKLSLPGVFLSGAILFALSRFLVYIITGAFKRYLEKREERGKGEDRRLLTLTRLAAGAAKYAVYIAALFIFLHLCRINTSTLLATAGIGSLAVAMGAQEIIRDVINGFFIIFDDQFAVGDYVECAGKEGYVHSLGFRTTVIREFDGSMCTIPNSEIRIVTNRGRGKKRAKVVVPVDRSEDPERVIQVIQSAAEGLKGEYSKVEMEVWGVTSFIDNGYEITVVAWDDALFQFDLEYSLRKFVVTAMNREGINIPIGRLKSIDTKEEMKSESAVL